MTSAPEHALESAIANPERFYVNPAEILADLKLTPEQKIAALKNWEDDQKALTNAENEGPGMEKGGLSSGELLREILLTEQELEDAPEETQVAREAVCTFYDAKSLQDAIDALQVGGFMRQELSVLADERVIQEKLGRLYASAKDAADDPAAPRGIFIPPEAMGEAEGAVIGFPLYAGATAAAGGAIATGGTILEAILAAIAGGGAGAGIGTVLAMLIARNHAQELGRQIDRGGLLLWVHLRAPGMEKKAREILGRHAAHDIHVHEIVL